MIRQRWAIALAVIAILTTDVASAGVITGYNGAVGGGTATVNGMYSGPIDTYYPNDATPEGAGGVSPNPLTVVKNFTMFAPIDMSFSVTNSGGVTSYLFDETVANNTGVNWTDFRFILGTGTGAAFVPLAPGSVVEFDPTNPAGADSFSDGVQTEVTVTWTGPPGIANGGVGIFEVQILVFDIAPPATGYDFTLRESPSVPEPSSVALCWA